jgi:hypothetical protein
MLENDKTPVCFKSWHIVRNYLIKKYPVLRHYELDYVKGQERKLLNRILLLTGISEKKLENEIQNAIDNADRPVIAMHYF